MIEDGYDSRQVMGNTKGVSSSAPGLLSRASGRTDGGARALLSRGRGGGVRTNRWKLPGHLSTTRGQVGSG